MELSGLWGWGRLRGRLSWSVNSSRLLSGAGCRESPEPCPDHKGDHSVRDPEIREVTARLGGGRQPGGPCSPAGSTWGHGRCSSHIFFLHILNQTREGRIQAPFCHHKYICQLGKIFKYRHRGGRKRIPPICYHLETIAVKRIWVLISNPCELHIFLTYYNHILDTELLIAVIKSLFFIS